MRASLQNGMCPNCGKLAQFRRGPSGGLALNIECMGCGARFNITEYRGELVLAQPLPPDALALEWPDRGQWCPAAAVHRPPNQMAHIDSVFAYLSKDASGNEGVCAGPVGPSGMLLPLIAADVARLRSIAPLAEAIARATGMEVTLVEFTTRKDLRTISPKGSS